MWTTLPRHGAAKKLRGEQARDIKNQWYFIFFSLFSFRRRCVTFSNMLIYLCCFVVYFHNLCFILLTFYIEFESFAALQFHGSHSPRDRPWQYIFIENYLVKTYFHNSCRFPGISVRNVRNVVEELPRRTGWDGPESSFFISPASPATSAEGSSRQVNSSLCWTIRFYVNRTTWRT